MFTVYTFNVQPLCKMLWTCWLQSVGNKQFDLLLQVRQYNINGETPVFPCAVQAKPVLVKLGITVTQNVVKRVYILSIAPS